MKIIIDAYKMWDRLGNSYLNGKDVELEIIIEERNVIIDIDGFLYSISRDEFTSLVKFLSE